MAVAYILSAALRQGRIFPAVADLAGDTRYPDEPLFVYSSSGVGAW